MSNPNLTNKKIKNNNKKGLHKDIHTNKMLDLLIFSQTNIVLTLSSGTKKNNKKNLKCNNKLIISILKISA